MASFISVALLRSHPLPVQSHPASLRRHKYSRKTPLKWRMSFDNRFTEFSLRQPSDSDNSQPTHTSPSQMDWEQWLTSDSTENIPAIPFPPTQVFMPGEVKRLHLYEARFLELFETVVLRYDKRCAHVLIDSRRRAMAAIGSVISVKEWRRLDIGVSVLIEAVGRVNTSRLTSSSPFLRGDFESFHDLPLSEEQLITARKLEVRFWKAFHDVLSLSLQMGSSPMRQKIDTASSTMKTISAKGEVPQSTDLVLNDDKVIMLSPEGKKQLFEAKLHEAASRAVNYQPIDFTSDVIDDEMLARRVQGLSFAGWEFFPSGPAARQKAIEQCNTVARFTTVVENLEQHSRKLAAQLALQSVFPG